CGKCHTESEKVWKKSKHAVALKTLEREGHDRDPDCVECHVVGLASIYGFTSRKATPGLTDVGCESCHGPGAKHSLTPKEVPMGKVGQESCMPCHKSENSPHFDFAKYWAKIAHK
ncbi:MAG: cytochrome c family protein, partial [Chlorobia bacterium]|nr:cytochrome c family protein [Fimbriimonadaceae bacterium]